MTFIQWSDEKFSVSNDVIDEQHKSLVSLINELHKAMKDRKTKEIIDEIIAELFEYTASHFAHEEELFKKWKYENEAEHIQEHKKFVAEVKKFKDDFKAGKLFLSSKIMNFLKSWLLTHIKVSDQKYAKHLK